MQKKPAYAEELLLVFDHVSDHFNGTFYNLVLHTRGLLLQIFFLLLHNDFTLIFW